MNRDIDPDGQQTLSLQEALELALKYQTAGDLVQAEGIYQDILHHDPDQPIALHLLGMIALEVGKFDIALDLIGKAIAIMPDFAEAHNSLGSTFQELGKLHEAEASYRSALAIAPDHPEANFNLGIALHGLQRLDESAECFRKTISTEHNHVQAHYNLGSTLLGLGQLDEAAASFRRATEIKPDYVEAHYNLGIVRHELKEFREAAAGYSKALAINPDYAEAHFNLGITFEELGSLQEAVESYQKALVINPDLVDARYNLGGAFQKLGRYEEAADCFRKILVIWPDHVKSWFNLGIALQELDRLSEAEECYRKALAIEPDSAKVHHNLGIALQTLRRLPEAVECVRKALAIKPHFAEAHNNLGVLYRDLGQVDDALKSLRKAISIKPDFPVAHSNLIFTMLYCPDINDADILQEAVNWDARHAYHGEIKQHENVPDPARRLRIGYLSADFREHAVCYFLEALLAKHDSKEVEVFCYAEVSQPDHVTDRYKNHVDHWRSTIGVNDEQLAETIRADKIDIIVDCTGHTANGRLRALSLKPAPIQINNFTVIGYTSGVGTVDYVFSDPVLTPPDTGYYFSEEVISLPNGIYAFRPDPDWPEVAPLPPVDDGFLFACVGDPVRIGASTIALWKEVLETVPNSRLLFKHIAYGNPEVREMWRHKFIELEGRTIFEGIEGGWERNMGVYGKIHMVLDTLPFSGGSSALIPLWMGVPVVTMTGDSGSSRFGAATVTHAGFPEFCADTREGYLGFIRELANDPSRMGELRRGMRDTIRASDIMDARARAADVESAYRKIWHEWCENKGTPNHSATTGIQ